MKQRIHPLKLFAAVAFSAAAIIALGIHLKAPDSALAGGVSEAAVPVISSHSAPTKLAAEQAQPRTNQGADAVMRDDLGPADLRDLPLARARQALLDSGVLEQPLAASFARLRKAGRLDLMKALDIDAAVAACARARRWLEHGVEPLRDGSIRRPPNAATVRYLSVHCRPLWEELGTLDEIERIVARDLRGERADDLPSVEAMLSSDLKPFKPGQYSVAEIRDGLDPINPLDIRAEMAIFALKSKSALVGFDWVDFDNTMWDTRIAMFGHLLGAKFGCSSRGACAPGSPMLIALCGAPEPGIYCQINANLTQIAADSLTTREFALWQAAERTD